MSYENIDQLYKKAHHIDHALQILYWDEASLMPKGGGAIRSDSRATLEGMKFEMLSTERLDDWIQEAKAQSLSASQKRNLELVDLAYKKRSALSQEFVEHKVRVLSNCEQRWPDLRKENNWDKFQPLLEDVVEVMKQEGQQLGEVLGVEPYDALINEYEPGMNQNKIDPIFNQLKNSLKPILDEILGRQADQSFPKVSPVPTQSQYELGLRCMKDMGFDFEHGRLDTSAHPFCGGDPQDVRITTRYDEGDFTKALMGVLHETGHALYEQGLPRDLLHVPVGRAMGMASHESQSLFVEMQLCRSEPYLKYLHPILRQSLDSFELSFEELKKVYRKVEPSLIRVDADEVTYPFHVISRYEIEKSLFSGDLAVGDIPDAWNQKYRESLGIEPSNVKNGCMQDVHWSAGLFGYFPSYTLGALIAAQLAEKLSKDLPDHGQNVENGEFAPVVDWLRTNFHGRGSQQDTLQVVLDLTGEPLGADAFLRHLQSRYLP